MFMDMRQNGTDGLSVRQRDMVRRYAFGVRHEEIARALGCHRSTVIRTLAMPEARAHIQALQDAADQEAIRAAVYGALAARQKQGRRRRRG